MHAADSEDLRCLPARRRGRRWALVRSGLMLFVLALGTAFGPGQGVATDDTEARAKTGQVRLYLLEDPGCPFCARWTAEVQPGYLKSPEGAFAPLIRRYRSDPEARRFARVNYSPTFILVRGDEEVGRIVGYMGADMFWAQLEPLLRKAGFD